MKSKLRQCNHREEDLLVVVDHKNQLFKTKVLYFETGQKHKILNDNVVRPISTRLT